MLYEIDPLRDPRWWALVQRHLAASVFHSRQWLDALCRSYNYEPVVFTDTPPGESLQNGLLFCRVQSWLTGDRLVSLPFSDHCDLLVDDPSIREAMLNALTRLVGQEGRYVEVRPAQTLKLPDAYQPAAQYVWHVIDLRPELDVIFSSLHKNHARRAIRKAERVGVQIDVGNSATLLHQFYSLHRDTRQRHRVPVQPFEWFRNLEASFRDQLQVYVARLDGRPIASILTLAHGRTLVFKYGCSDIRHKSSGATPALFWRAIRDAKDDGAIEFDLGRSDVDDHGLIAFKDHLGAARRTLCYYQYRGDARQLWNTRLTSTVEGAARRFVPAALLTRTGARFYRHFA